MARGKKSKQDTLIDELLQDCHNPKDILGQNGLLKQLSKRIRTCYGRYGLLISTGRIPRSLLR
jgi:hypothetical protein